MADPITTFQRALPYLSYYRQRLGARLVRTQTNTDKNMKEADPAAAQRALESSVATADRRSMLAQAQAVGGYGDLTDSVVQDAAARERRRRTVGVGRASSFLSSSQSLLAGGL